FDVVVKTVNAIHSYTELLAAASVDGGIGAVESHFEIGPGLTDDETISKALAAQAAGVGDANKIVPVGRGGEQEAGIGAEFAVAVVVIGVINGEDREAIGKQFGPGRVRFDNV